MRAFVLGLAFLSGTTSLIYEICWVRLLGYNLGSDSDAIGVVFSAFFMGMALGSYLVSKVSHNTSRLIKYYISIELCIGISGILLFYILTNLEVLISTFPVLGTSIIGKILISQLLLIIPTVCIGAAFPLLASISIRSQNHLGLHLSQLYTFNILGAIIGSVVAGFILIPTMGIDGAIFAAVTINLVISVVVWKSQVRLSENMLTLKVIDRENKYTRQFKEQSSIIAATCLALTGFMLIAFEIIWTRYFSIITGASLYSFSIILAVTLSGIALGSWVVRNYLDRNKVLENAIVGILIFIAALILLQKTSLSNFSEFLNFIQSVNLSGAFRQVIYYGVIFVYLFPVTFLFGILFPLSLKLYVKDVREVQVKISKAFAINTVASVVGAALVSFWLIHKMGINALLISIIILIGVFVFSYLRLLGDKKHINIKSVVIMSIMLLSVFSAPVDLKIATEAVIYTYDGAVAANRDRESKYLYLAEGKQSIISLVSFDENYALLNSNGLQESMIPLTASAPPLMFETLQAYIPYFFHDNAKNALVIGYGGGNTTQAFLDTGLADIEVVEIEPEIIEAVKKIKNGPAKDLLDSRIELTIGDARSKLITSRKQYDIISSQPSHPWLTGSANILTQEFFSLAKSRLTENGIMTQWIALFRMDATALKSILKAFYTEFPYGFTLTQSTSGDMMLIGSKSAVNFNSSKITKKMQENKIARKLSQLDIYQVEDLFWIYSLSRRNVMKSVRNIEPNTDVNIISEVRLAALYENGSGDENPLKYINSNENMDVLPMFSDSEPKTVLFKAGKKFLQWGAMEKTINLISALQKTDEFLADTLRHELLYWQKDYQSASNLFSQRKNWLENTYYRQFEIDLNTNNSDMNLNKLINKVTSPILKQTMTAQLFSLKEDWVNLSRLDPLDINIQRWKLVGDLKLGDRVAAHNLVGITPTSFENMRFLIIVEKFFRESGLFKESEWISLLLNNMFISRKLFYNKMLKIAEANNNLAWVENLNMLKLELKLAP